MRDGGRILVQQNTTVSVRQCPVRFAAGMARRTVLRKVFNIDESRLRFALQIFSDMNQKKEEQFWQTFLKVSPQKFYKTINTRSGSIGTYREKSKHGVLTIYFNNKKCVTFWLVKLKK